MDTEAEIISYQDGFIIKYPQLEHYYALKFFADEFEQREFISDKPDTFFAQNANDHVKKLIIDENSHQHYSNWFLRPLHLKAKTKQDIYGLVANGSLSEMQNLLLDYGNAEIIAEKFSQITPTMSQPLGQQLLSASNFTNVVYPIYTAGEFIRHSTPGRWWDCLYTWDSGFIGLGLLESDIERAKENLLVYLTPANAENAFIHHGSPVPVQFYLIQEIYNKSGDIDFIHAIYPRLKQYYLFLAGKLGSSDTNRLGSNLLQTWSYFYNSGGWDDYPAQKYCHDKRLVLDTTPAITTSQVIRMAKILFGFATILSYPDTEEYTLDIEQMSQALINYSWDASSGYFSYVQHPKMQHLQAEDGSNFNQGLDGLYPLVAGVGNPQQQQMMISHLKNPDELWTTVGISAVSRRASYYRNDGYWNGTVWFAHQWLFWKAMFDVGESEFADKIAQTALELWENECQLTYRSLEHFVIYSGRGAGWHSFSGLSCPIINWYHAYFTPGRINCGFDCLITKYESDNNIITLEIRKFNNKTSSILIVRPAGWKKLSAKINGVASELTPSFSSQAFWISLPQAEQIKLTLEG